MFHMFSCGDPKNCHGSHEKIASWEGWLTFIISEALVPGAHTNGKNKNMGCDICADNNRHTSNTVYGSEHNLCMGMMCHKSKDKLYKL